MEKSRKSALKKSWSERIKQWFANPLEPSFMADTEIFPAAALLLRFFSGSGKSCALIAPSLPDAEEITASIKELANLSGIGEVPFFFLPEISAGAGTYIPGNEAMRSNTVNAILKNKAPAIYIGSIEAMLAPLPPPDDASSGEIILAKGKEYSFSELLRKLTDMDYDDEIEVSSPGEFARRGGIIDIFSLSDSRPVRVEFFGDTVESIRPFSTVTQLSNGEINSYTVSPRSGSANKDSGIDFFDYLLRIKASLCFLHPARTETHLEKYGDLTAPKRWHDIRYSTAGIDKLNLLDAAETAAIPEAVPAGIYPASAHITGSLPLGISEGNSELLRQMVASQLAQWLDSDTEIVLTVSDERNMHQISEWCKAHKIDLSAIHTVTKRISSGFIIPEINLAVITEKELFPSAFRKKVLRTQESSGNGAAEENALLADLDEGDYAVHITHGIGIFKGIREIETCGVLQESIVMEFDGGTEIYVPVWQADQIGRYIGAGSASVQLSKVGSKKWAKQKAEAAKAAKEFAGDMIKIQAARSASPGFSFPPDNLDQKAFENSFEYDDTRDQSRASAEIKNDMEADKPMDRLLCGDVGFGKTEVAMRAAFKCISAGRQVAILVPTTVLAQQHFYSFTERFAEYPVIVEMLSRFRDKSEQREIIKRLKEGSIDIIIGTHRLIQGDIEFKELGLVIIDEEQRFGVEHKEKFKRLRTLVDVLTMTATPIPRTLYMSIAGIKNLSTITTAPGLRLPVQTVVAQHDNEIIMSAIRRESARGGQVFYLHNRVGTIEKCRDTLQAMMPDIRFGIAHGRMKEDELEEIMASFMEGKMDVLICTTIIESGLDIPNANTIIIERADRFGLAELYQLRGRVGRCSRQAYAYLLLPHQHILTGDARKRISAIRRYCSLGSGFKLALRDLEIRGAGNLIGHEQSGYINNVGFDLYCAMLRDAVSSMKGLPGKAVKPEIRIPFLRFGLSKNEDILSACFPASYISAERLRMDAYRTLASASGYSDIRQLEESLTDRFGKLPEEARHMLDFERLRIAVMKTGAHSLSISGNKILLEKNNGILRINGRIPILDEKLKAEEKLRIILEIAISLEPANSAKTSI